MSTATPLSPSFQGRTFSPLRTSVVAQSGPAIKLEHVTEKFAGIFSDLEQEKQNRRVQDQAKFQMLAETVGRIEKSLEAEVKRRAESDKQLQTHFEGELRALQERTTAQASEFHQALNNAVDQLSNRIQDMSAMFKTEKEARRSDMEGLAISLVSKVNECVAALDEERTLRQQEQTVSLKRFGEDLLTLQQRIDGEKMSRDTELSSLRTEIHEVLANRNMQDEQFKNSALDELQALKSAMALEREERIAEDDEIVQAVNDYTRALQEGLKIVNS